ncbi:tryptophan-rich sensory protein [Acidobacteria bacterium AB60]|nr:tryptophan-rich sensory protein [Acidobacteria bacterium AB60]
MCIASLVLWILVCQSVGVLGGFWTAAEIPGWYRGLTKPTFNPPNWIFGPVWTTLYLLMAISAWKITGAAPSRERTLALTLFAAQLLLNLAWSWIFFREHAIRAAFAEILCMWLAIGATTLLFAQISTTAAWLMAPYWAWVSFASLLNAAIVRLNPA